MVSVRIGPDVRFAVVGTKAYLSKRRIPKTPRLRIRASTSPSHTWRTWAWEFEKNGRELNV